MIATAKTANNATTLPADFRLSRAELFTLLGAVFGVLPIVFCAMRVMVVSGGDYNSLRMLVQNLDVKALVLATILPIGGTLIFWTQFVLLLFAVANNTPEQYKRLLRALFISLLPISVAILWVATPRRQVFINIAILASILLVIVVAGKVPGAIGRLLTTLSALVLVALLFAGVVTVIVKRDMWVPFERITLKDHSVVEGYILGVDEEWTRYMDSSNRSIRIVQTDQIKARDLVAR